MCLICAQIYAEDDWSRDPRDQNSDRVAGGPAALNRHQEAARRLRILNAMVQPHGVRVKTDSAGGYAITDLKGKTVTVAGLDELWYRLARDFDCRVDVLDP
jgi:hypothetical protein